MSNTLLKYQKLKKLFKKSSVFHKLLYVFVWSRDKLKVVKMLVFKTIVSTRPHGV